jgi:hypothetical protein
VSDSENPGAGGAGGQLSSSLIGSAAAGITLAAAFIYGAGALSVGLKLAFTRLPWESVVGQLPNTLLITNGFGQVVLPAVIIGMLGSVLLNYLVHGSGRRSDRASLIYQVRRRLQHYLRSGPSARHLIAWLVIAGGLGAIESAIMTLFYSYHASRYVDLDVLVPSTHAFYIIWVLSSAAIGIALIFAPPPISAGALSDSEIGQTPAEFTRLAFHRPRRRDAQANEEAPGEPGANVFHGRNPWSRPAWLWQALVATLVTFAVIPGLAGISASALFPYTTVCSPVYPGGQGTGNLIAISNGWAYLVEYHSHEENGKTYATGEYFRVVPLSSVAQFEIGFGNNCAK